MHVGEFYQRIPLYSANLVEVKGDISLESVQVFAGGMGGSMGFPQMGVNMSMGPPQMGGGFNVGFGFPSAPPAVVTTTPGFSVINLLP